MAKKKHFAASFGGNPNIPVEMAGNAIDVHFKSLATCRQEPTDEISFVISSPSPQTGPTAWII